MAPFDEVDSRTPPGYNSRTGAYHVRFDRSDSTSLLDTVVRSVAAITDTRPTDMETLHGRIDTDALGELFSDTTDRVGAVSFHLNGCGVIVYSDGEVEIHPPKEHAPV